MQTENSIALKEWAAVCLALAEGRQSLLVRKGGIAEGSGGFRMEHDEFWLFPTQFHQSPDQLTADGAALLGRVQASAPPPGRLLIDCYAVVKSVAFVEDEGRLAELDGLACDVGRGCPTAVSLSPAGAVCRGRGGVPPTGRGGR